MKINKIQQLNDAFRKNFSGGQVMMTSQVSNLPPDLLLELVNEVKTYNSFTKDNDPYQEHDLGKIILRGNSYLWKIDYYDKALTYGSPDPSNPQITTRVLTIMCSDDY